MRTSQATILACGQSPLRTGRGPPSLGFMPRAALIASALLASLLPVAAGCAPGSGAARAAVDSSDVFVPATGLRLVEVARGLDRPLYVTAPAGDPRLFVVDQGGRVKIGKAGRVLARPFLDLSDRISAGGERGLLSIAFHPPYARNGVFFVHYTTRQWHTPVQPD